jgi:tetratricopeptide (TPR) repeat protein
MLAQLSASLGRFDEARSCAHHALELDPEMVFAHTELGNLGGRADDEAEIGRLQMLLNDGDRPLQLRAHAGFALGRLLDNADRCDDAFPCFAQANAFFSELIAGSEARFDRAAFQQQIAGLI